MSLARPNVRSYLMLVLVVSVGEAALSGCALLIPERTVRYIKYPVQAGDTIYALSRRFDVSPKRIIESNKLSNPSHLRVGQELKIPYHGQDVQGRAVGGAPVKAGLHSSSLKSIKLNGAERHIGKLVWPVKGAEISSHFGWRWLSFHEGIDLQASYGTPVRAAHAGVVAYSGSSVTGYGNLIVLRGDDILTIYAHNQRNLVKAGRRVERGEKIALVGATGKASGPHLHFETRVRNRDGKNAAVNPLVFYP